tara:strand:+ start:107 stop:400 length:294 start_codon:yes stop_codon:yes gene_type:complete
MKLNPFAPLIRFRGTTFFKTFLLNAFFVGFIAGLTYEFRRFVDEHRFTRELPDIPHKIGATIILSTAAGLVTFFFMRFLTGTGEGMLDSKHMIPKLF